MNKRIQAKLAEIERQEGVWIPFACESGSRAWGFASTDSDWDVRFLYVRPLAWYLAVDLEHKRDVIERPIENNLDINGWDLRKALWLFNKSNPSLLEWLDSPLIYREQGSVPGRLRALRRRCFSPRASWHHYLHMAEGNFRAYLRGEEVWLKKCLYVIRPLLALRWLERHGSPVPTAFHTLLQATLDQEGDVRHAIDHLLHAKMAGVELSRGPRNAVLSAFLEAEFARHAGGPGSLPAVSPPMESLNRLFREALEEAARVAFPLVER